MLDRNGFKNVHYFAAGATAFGSEVQGGYEYADKHYHGKFAHAMGASSCTDCHSAHSLEVKTDNCASCHDGDPMDYRMAASTADYDGDGDNTEGVKAEIDDLIVATYAAIQDYAANTAGTAIP